MTPSPVQPSPQEERAQVPPAKQAPSHLEQRPPEFPFDRQQVQPLPPERRTALPAEARSSLVAQKLPQFRFDRLQVQR